MFCRSCGKEIPENAKFCSGCGAPVSAPAEEPRAAEVPVEGTPEVIESPAGEPAVQSDGAAPVQPTEPENGPQDDLSAALEQPKAVVVAAAPEIQQVPPAQQAENAPVLGKSKKRGGTLLLLGLAAVAVIVLVVVLVKMLPSGGGKETFLYLTDDDELMFRKDLKVKTEGVELTDDEIASVFFSQDGKYIYYLESSDYGDTGTLYRAETAKIGKKGFSPEKVSPDVSNYNISVLPSGGAVYIRGSGSDGQLRYYDGKESYKLASGVSYFSLNEKGTYAYYAEFDSSDYSSSLYRVEIKDGGEKERILKGADTIYSSYDADVLVYSKSNGSDSNGMTTYDIYSQAPGGDRTKLISDVYSVLDVTTNGTKVSISYLTAETEEHTLYDFVRDSMASSDAAQVEPSSSDYQVLNSWGWYTTDWDAYNAAYEEWWEVQMRNDTRQSLKDTNYNLTTYNLNRYEDGKDTNLAVGLASSYPACSPADGIYLYAKSEQDVSAVCDVSDLDYWGEIYDKIDTAERVWYQNVGGKESEMDLDEDASISSLYVLNGSEAAVVVYEDDETILQSYNIGKNGLTFSSTITDDEFAGLTIGRDGKQDALYYFTDIDSNHTYGDLMRYAGGNKSAVAKETARAVLLDDGKTVFKMEDVDYDSRRGVTECSLYLVKDGKNERISDDVALYGIAFLDAKRVVYISDGDLYVWNGSASEKLASDVTRFWSSQQADRQTLSLNW